MAFERPCKTDLVCPSCGVPVIRRQCLHGSVRGYGRVSRVRYGVRPLSHSIYAVKSGAFDAFPDCTCAEVSRPAYSSLDGASACFCPSH
jgi:hypothetical protein